MDKKARQKEAERTLNRIRKTRNRLDEGSAWQDPFAKNEEFQRMKKLIESGYSHPQSGSYDAMLRSIGNHSQLLLRWLLLVSVGIVLLSWIF